jgi:hypothetical protein
MTFARMRERRRRILEAIIADPNRMRKSIAAQFGVSTALVKSIAERNKIRHQPRPLQYCAVCNKKITFGARFCMKHVRPQRRDLDEDIKRMLTTTDWGKGKIGKNLGCGTSIVQRVAKELIAAGVKLHPARRRSYVPPPKVFKTNAQLAAGIKNLLASSTTPVCSRAGLQRKLEKLQNDFRQ